jgi:P-aminobenzoate N-oxygenase AurF
VKEAAVLTAVQGNERSTSGGRRIMPQYSYAECLQRSYRVNWKISDVVSGQWFDTSRRWLPGRLSAADTVASLSRDEKRKLSHIEMGSYSHLFGYVEEYIAPKMVSLAQDFQIDQREAFDALTNFAAEEVKHMNLFREVRGHVDAAVGFPLALISGQKEVARAVLSKHTGAVLLLTAAIEWFTQLHYLTCMKDNESIDPFTRHIFKCHWLEESQHARMDHLETLRAFKDIGDFEREMAVEDLIELVGAVDGLLQEQSRLDVDSLARYLDRSLGASAHQDVYNHVLAAKRYTFIESGVTHPNFVQLFAAVTTPAQQERVQKALVGVLQPAA